MNNNQTLQDIIKGLNLIPHPEGGWYRETYRSSGKNDTGDCHSTAIFHLVSDKNGTAWHRIRHKDEIWHFYAGDPAELRIANPEGFLPKSGIKIFGPDVGQGQEPQVLIPGDHWQSVRCLGKWTLFGCTVSPGFEFENFEMAPKGWSPSE